MRASKITPTTDPKQSREQIRAYLATLKGYQGLGNVINMNQDGDTVKTTMVYRVRESKWVKQ